jgi:NO-binding membrane sensor protein with MHYT domain
MRSKILVDRMLAGSYDPLLVLVSIIVAVLTSYTALQLASSVFATKGTATRVWLGCGAIAMGTGIWAMHFIGMLAFSLPVELSYQASTTALSLGLAVLASALALGIICRPTLGTWHFTTGGLVMGMGIAGMHYTGMAALNMHPEISYDPVWFGVSLVIAILASTSALCIASHLKRPLPHVWMLRLAASIFLGFGIAAMHYAGMAGAMFHKESTSGTGAGDIDTYWLGALVLVVTMSLLVMALTAVLLEQHMQRQKLAAKRVAIGQRLALRNAEQSPLGRLPKYSGDAEL